MKLKSAIVFALFACITSVQAQELKTADAVLAKYFEATGGLDKWKSMKTRKIEGTMTTQGANLTLLILEKSPIKQKATFTYQGMEIIQAYDGVDAWTVNPLTGSKEPAKMSEEETKSVKEKEFESAFIDYKKKGHEITLLGTELVDQTKCYKIQLVRNKNNPKDDTTEIHYFDADNFVQVLQTGVAEAGPMKGVEIKTYTSDYQDVNGMMLPFTLEAKVNGQTVQKLTYTKITINEPIDDSVFAFPKKP